MTWFQRLCPIKKTIGRKLGKDITSLGCFKYLRTFFKKSMGGKKFIEEDIMELVGEVEYE